VAAVGIVLHHERPRAVALAGEAVDWLTAHGHEARVPEDDVEVVEAAGLACTAAQEFGKGLDLVVSLGGDGTMLRTVDLVTRHDVPVLGVNVGQLGYLTVLEPAGLVAGLARFFAGDHGIEERMTLRVSVESASGGSDGVEQDCLNEAVLEKTAPGRTVRLAVDVNGRFFTSYAADGLIVATPTGSTAYSLSARGPIVSPRHRALLVTPVAPHMLFDRTLVLDATESVRVEVVDNRAATLSLDGRDLGVLSGGDAIVCTAGAHAARLVTFGDRDFHDILKAKFGLADR